MCFIFLLLVSRELGDEEGLMLMRERALAFIWGEQNYQVDDMMQRNISYFLNL